MRQFSNERLEREAKMVGAKSAAKCGAVACSGRFVILHSNKVLRDYEDKWLYFTTAAEADEYYTRWLGLCG